MRYGHLDEKPDARSLILSQKRKPMAPHDKTKHNAFHPYTDDEVTNGLKSLQNSFGLKVSGELNEETIKIMESPRCGFSDKGHNPFQMTIHHRNKRYTIKYKLSNGKTTTFKWTKKTVTWNILIYYKYLPLKVQDETLEKAFKFWEYSSPLIFKKTSSTTPDIRIQFAPSKLIYLYLRQFLLCAQGPVVQKPITQSYIKMLVAKLEPNFPTACL